MCDITSVITTDKTTVIKLTKAPTAILVSITSPTNRWKKNTVSVATSTLNIKIKPKINKFPFITHPLFI